MSQKPTYEELKRRVQELEKEEIERKQAEQALSESEERLGSIFRSAPIGIGLVVDRELKKVNSRLCTITGYDEEELIGRSSRILYPSDEDFEIVGREKYAQIRDHGTGTVETHWQRKDGTIIDVLLSSTPVDLKDRSKGVTFTALDITERKRAEDYLKNFQKIISTTQDGIALIDSNYRYKLVNKAYKTAFAIREENFLGRSIAEYLGEHVFESIVKPRIDRCLQGERVSYEDWFDYPAVGKRRVEVGYFPYRDENDHIVGVVSNTRDITQQYQAQEALVQSEKKYRDLFESNQDAITIFRIDPSGSFATKFLDFNEASLALGGYSKEEMKALRPDDFERGATKEVIERRLAEIESQGHAHFETVLRNKNGEEIPIEINVRKILYEGSPAMMNIARDIRSRKNIENDLREGELRYRTLANSGQALIWTSGPDKLCNYFNDPWLSFTGRTLDQELGNGWTEGVHPEDFERCLQIYVSAFDNREKFSMEYRLRHASGDYRWIQDDGTPRFNDKGVFLGYIGHCLDISQRKQAEETLRLRESHLSAIIENLPGLFWLKDTKGRFLSVNTEFSKSCGLDDPKFVVGKTDLDIWPEELADKYLEDDVNVLNSGKPVVIEESISWQGEIRWFETFKNPVFDNQGLVIGTTGYSHDITERKKFDQELKNSVSLLEASLESTADGILIVGKQRKLARWNQKFSQLWEIPNEILSSRDDDKIIDYILGKLVDPEQFITKVSELYEQPEHSSFDQIEFLDGRIFERHSQPQRIGDAIVGRVWSFRDVTERKQAEKALRESEERYRHLFNISNDAVFVHLGPSGGIPGRFIEVNKVACERLGYVREELLQMSPIEIDAPDTLAEVPRIMEQLIQHGQAGWEGIHLTKDGRRIPVEITNRLFEYHGTQMILSSARDITERKQAEEEQEKLQSQLNQAQKMESVGRLAGGIAHDFNNMLGVILGHVEMAMDEINNDHPLFHDLREIHNAAQRSADITRQLLAFARKQTIAPKVIDLNRSVEGILKMLQRLIGEDVALIWKPGYKLWTVKVDSSQLDQILANLCVNARDAISDVGTITIETSNFVFDEEYCKRDVCFVAGDYVMLALSDTGCGMDNTVLKHIFEPFYTTKDISKGTGLGLATVYGIVKQNNGFINVYSEPGRGTTFKIYLPRHRSNMDHAGTEATSKPVKGGHETVLLVEDEPSILKMTSIMLQRLGYSVTAVGTPGEAIQVVENSNDKIHLLIRSCRK